MKTDLLEVSEVAIVIEVEIEDVEDTPEEAKADLTVSIETATETDLLATMIHHHRS